MDNCVCVLGACCVFCMALRFHVAETFSRLHSAAQSLLVSAAAEQQ